MSQRAALMHVTHSGPRAIIGFETSRVPEDERFAEVQERLQQVVNAGCKELVFDLKGVRIIPSQLLGLMAWLCRNKVDVAIYNASEEIRETLAFTQLDTILEVREGEVER